MTHIAKARKTRDAALVVVDPYETRTAKVADHHVALRPGTDGALACGIMHVLFAEDFADRDYLARYTDHPQEFEAHLASRTPAWASAITGIPAAEIVALARMIGRIERTYIRLGYGFTRSRNGRRQHARRHLHRRRHRRLAARGRRRDAHQQERLRASTPP